MSIAHIATFTSKYEPGYFYAAMYVSYALNIAEAVSLVVATYVFTQNSTSPMVIYYCYFNGLLPAVAL